MKQHMQPPSIQTWAHHNTETISGFLTGSVITTSLMGFAVGLIQTVIIAFASGAVGAFAGHIVKKYLTKRDNETNKN